MTSPPGTIHATALAQPVAEGPTDEALDKVIFQALREYREQESPFGGPTDERQLDRVKARAILARWGHPTPPAPEPGEAPAAWLYKGEPDFDGATWRENWRATTDEQVARFKAEPGCPVPLFRRSVALVAAPVVAPVAVSERLRQCPTHDQQPPNAWGCPECVRELRESLENLRHIAARHVDELDDLRGRSEGVYGLHHNGDEAPWIDVFPGGYYEQLSALGELRDAIVSHEIATLTAEEVQP
jgi:hypothetical protein